MDHLVLRHPSYMRGTTYPFSLSVTEVAATLAKMAAILFFPIFVLILLLCDENILCMSQAKEFVQRLTEVAAILFFPIFVLTYRTAT
jgi:hypothetical protein